MTSTSAAPASGYLSTGEVGARIGATSQYVRELIHAGVFEAIDIGVGERSRYRVATDSVAKFLRDRAVSPAQTEVA